MFGYSKTFPQEQKSRKRWWLAGWRGMYDDDAAEMRCTTRRQEDVSTERGRCGLTGLADASTTCQKRAVACGPDMGAEERWKLPWHRREA
jgi:hypothetical protein